MAWKNDAKTAEAPASGLQVPDGYRLGEPVVSIGDGSATGEFVVETPEAVPFVESSAALPPRSGAQIEWMQKHPDYAPMAHGAARFINRGTLLPDGTFLPEDQHPPMDGGGAMSVGVPVMARRR